MSVQSRKLTDSRAAGPRGALLSHGCVGVESERMRTTISVRFLGSRRLARAGLREGILGAVLLAVTACGYFGGGSLPARAQHAQAASAAHARQPADPATQALAAMVEAVGSSGAQPPVELRFSIRNRPQVGEDDEVDYAVVPQDGGIDALHLAFGSPDDGLQVVSHGLVLAALKPASGVPVFGSVTVRPLKPGLFMLRAAVGVGSASGTTVWPFSIPVIAGENPAEGAASPP